jgi:hypothetical protein
METNAPTAPRPSHAPAGSPTGLSAYRERLLRRAASLSTLRVKEAEATYRSYAVTNYDPRSGGCDVTRVLSDGQPGETHHCDLITRTCDCRDFHYTIERINFDLAALGIDAGVECRHCTTGDLHVAEGTAKAVPAPARAAGFANETAYLKARGDDFDA